MAQLAKKIFTSVLIGFSFSFRKTGFGKLCLFTFRARFTAPRKLPGNAKNPAFPRSHPKRRCVLQDALRRFLGSLVASLGEAGHRLTRRFSHERVISVAGRRTGVASGRRSRCRK